jgi:glyoxylase I family protein
MSSLTLDHVAIPVADAARSRRFYEDVLGLPLVDAMSGDDWEGRPWLLMFFGLGDGRQLALCCVRGAKWQGERGLPSDARHYALATEALEPWRTRLRSARVDFREEDHGAQHSLFVADPDGTMLEITAPATPELPRKSSARRSAERVVAEWVKQA